MVFIGVGLSRRWCGCYIVDFFAGNVMLSLVAGGTYG